MTSVHHRFETWVARTPDAVAISHRREQISYAALNRRANGIAHFLLAQGVRPDAVVGLLAGRSIGTIAAMLGILKAGAAYLPLDPTMPEDRLRAIVGNSGVAFVLTDQDRTNIPAAVRATDPRIATQLTANPGLSLHGDCGAYVLYTSGSSGVPKGVVVTHRGVVNELAATTELFEPQPGDRRLQFPSLAFDISVDDIFWTLSNGATLVLRTDEMSHSAHEFWKGCIDARITILQLTPRFWQSLLPAFPAYADAVLANLRMTVLAGEPIAPVAARQWFEMAGKRGRLMDCYGPTEATIYCHGTEIPATAPVDPSAPLLFGPPLKNLRAYVLDEEFEPLPVGELGQICVGGVGLARGYLGDPRRTAGAFVPDPFVAFPGERLYTTGDLGFANGQGHYTSTGRIDRQVKIRGFRVEPAEAEAALARHPAVKEAAVVAVERSASDLVLVAYWVPQAGRGTGRQELSRFVSELLPAYLVPADFVEIEEIPLNARGKLDRTRLPAPFQDEPARDFEPPATPFETLVADAFSKVLKVSAVGRRDNFFELGGDSMAGMRLMMDLGEELGMTIPLQDIFELPSVHELAERLLGRCLAESGEASEPL